jgi:Tol biopolymer transport system component
VLHDGVECPDLSPDGTRVAYKHAVPGAQRTWRVHVLDLRTMRDTALAEARSVDDQVEWLDDSRVVYGLQDQGPPPTLDVNLWTVPADGSGSPSLFLAHAESPAVIRTP